MTPEANEQDKPPNSPKQISLTSAENLTLMMADPESPEVKAIMDAHGIEFGDPVEADVDGVKMIVATSKEDFWTRDRKATEALVHGAAPFEQVAADHAQNLMEADPIADTEAGETPEVGEASREELSDELGKEAVEEVEQEAQAEGSEQATRIKAEYDRRVDTLLDQDGVSEIEGDLSKLEDETYRLAHALQPVRLQDASEQLRATIASIENDSYGIETARTRLAQIESELATVDSLLRAAAEAGIQDVKSITERTRKQITDVSGELQTMQEAYEDVSRGERVAVGPDADTGKIREELQAISTDFEAFAGSLDADRTALQEHSRILQVTVNQLSELIRQTYNGRLESSELHTLYATLLGVVEGVNGVSINRKTAPLIETTKGHLAMVRQQRNWE